MKETNEINASADKIKIIAYWVTTGIIILQSVAGAVLDLSGNPDFIKVFAVLGYPAYLMTILGIWRILAAIALAVPGFPRLKEWAYAGLFFDLTGAGASHLFAGDVQGSIFPFIFAAISVASWALRPSSRKLPDMHDSSAPGELSTGTRIPSQGSSLQDKSLGTTTGR